MELEALLERHPLRERLWGFRMLALYRAGRQAEALRVFQDARRVLADELGLEPLPELVDLEAAILARDPALHTGANGAAAHHGPHTAREATPRRQHGSVRRAGGEACQRHERGRQQRRLGHARPSAGNLPADLTRFVGRERERSAVVEHLRANRLVTLVGPGGVGKTRLLLAAARQLSEAGDVGDGAWFVGLAPLRDPLGVAPTVADVLGAADLGDAATQRTVTSARTTERLAESSATGGCWCCSTTASTSSTRRRGIVEDAARGCPGLTCSATSREGLGVPGECVAGAAAAEPAEAVQLFAERARRRARGSTWVATTSEPDAGRGDLPAPRRPAARHRAGRRPAARSCRIAEHRRPARRPLPAADRRAAAPCCPASRPCGPSSTGATTCSTTTSGASSSASRCSPAAAP